MILRSAPAFVLLACGFGLVPARAQTGGVLQGLIGYAQVTKGNPGEVEVKFFQGSKPNEGHQADLRFVVQYEGKAQIPKRWQGRARLLYADKVVAINGDDNSQFVFKLRDEPMPESLQKYKYKPIDVFGIAVYPKP
jgi:hypothetical protein